MDPLARALRNGLVSDALARATHYRDDSDWLARALTLPTTFIVPVIESDSLFDRSRPLQVRVIPAAAVDDAADLGPLVYLGQSGGQDYFALSVPAASGAEVLALAIPLHTTDGDTTELETPLLAFAKGICYWHQRSRFCGECGAATRSERGGHSRVCTDAGCGATFFPRTDPAIIVLAHDNDCCLLGRKSDWEPGRYSTIAGFVEPGETAEQAVVREVTEETAVRVDTLSYHSSQPWPFPGSLMLGFHAHARSREITLNDGELEDARWVTRDQVLRAMDKSGDLRLPPRISIARRLIEDWCRQTDG